MERFPKFFNAGAVAVLINEKIEEMLPKLREEIYRAFEGTHYLKIPIDSDEKRLAYRKIARELEHKKFKSDFVRMKEQQWFVIWVEDSYF